MGIVIDLKLRDVQILDSLEKEMGTKVIDHLMTPITQSFPWLLAHFGYGDVDKNIGCEPFKVSR